MKLGSILLIILIALIPFTFYFIYKPSLEIEPSEEVVPEEKSPTPECLGTLCGGICYEEVGKCCDERWIYAAQCCSDLDCLSTERCIENICKSIKHFSIAIFTDKNTYSKLSSEINRLKSDIVNDLTTKTQNIDVYVYYNWNSKEGIKNEIINLWRTKNLTGVILIGDIPTYTFSSEYYPDGIPSDFYYMDVENTCKYPTTKGCLNPRIWLGRITPPIKRNQGIELVRNYLNRNHDYRTGKLSFNRDILFYFPDPDISDVEERGLDIHDDSIYPNLRRLLPQAYSFSPSNVIVSRPNENLDDVYLNAIKKPYEIVYVSAHGTSRLHSSNIDYETIKNVKPQAMYYILGSCSAGKFTEDNYLAGWYLFSGNGLVVQACTEICMNMFPPPGNLKKYWNLLIKGEIFGNVIVPWVIETFLGDPTLRLRYDKIESDAELVIDKEKLEFGNVVVGTEKTLNFTIYNKGSEDLYVGVAESSIRTFKEPKIPVIEGVWARRYSLRCKWKTWGKIEPHSSVSCSFVFSPPTKGEYEYILDIYSNDEDDYWIRMLITGRGL